MKRAEDRKNILIVVDYFKPGFKGGGHIRSISNMIDQCRSHFDFYVLTRDRDFRDAEAYPNIRTNEWLEKYNCRVLYLSPENQNFKSLKKVINENSCKLIYLNGFFSLLSIKSIILRRLGKISNKPFLLAFRGEFSPSVLRTSKFKFIKKMVFIHLSRMTGLYRGILWHATSEAECGQLVSYFRGRIFVAPNLPPRPILHQERDHDQIDKIPQEARFVFISRISVVKNLDYALEVLKEIKGNVIFDIFGTIEDLRYWKQCERLIAESPANVHINYRGPVPNEEVELTIKKYQYFLFPTRGENFGHAILEALAAGRPVVISDQTPWRDLEQKKVGWDISLSDRQAFVGILQRCLDMNQSEYNELLQNVHAYYDHVINNSQAVKQTVSMMESAISRIVSQNI